MTVGSYGPLLAVRGITKSFRTVRAITDVDLDVVHGEVHALVGQNGSGKSTLIKVLAGLYPPDAMEGASYRGEPFAIGSAAAARGCGIRFIHQDLGLVSQLNAVDNLALGQGYVGRRWLSDRREHAAAKAVLAEFGLEIDVERPIGSLSVAEQTMIAIVRGIRGAGPGQLLVLDEPTASLPEREVQGLFKLLREIRARDGAVLYVTHRLTELFGLADRVTVLRDGRHVATSPIAKLTHDSLVELMIGSAPSAYYQPPPPPDSEVLLVAESLAGEAITNVGLHVHRGEIVGVTGLIGSGYDQLLGLMFGARRQTHGRLCLGGRVLRPNSPRDAVRAGIAYAPADRRRLSATADWTLRENITLPRISSIGPARWLSKRTEAAAVRPWLSSLNVVPADAERQLKTLSGGNQQKVVLARWLRCEPQILLLDEPTNGVDTGAKQAVYRTLAAAAGNGTGVVIASSDPEELVAVCDRVIVLRRGRVGAVLVGDELTTERVLSETMRAPREPPNLRHSVPSVLKAIKVR